MQRCSCPQLQPLQRRSCLPLQPQLPAALQRRCSAAQLQPAVAPPSVKFSPRALLICAKIRRQQPPAAAALQGGRRAFLEDSSDCLSTLCQDLFRVHVARHVWNPTGQTGMFFLARSLPLLWRSPCSRLRSPLCFLRSPAGGHLHNIFAASSRKYMDCPR